MSEAERAPTAADYLAEVITVEVTKLFVDHRYQRGVKKSSVKQLVTNWNWRRYLPIIVAHRGGSVGRFAVIDGQQRFMAAQELGIESLPAILIVARDLESEAEMFEGANTGASVGAGDRFKSEYLRKEATAVEIVGIAKEAGFELQCIKLGNSHGNRDPYSIDAVGVIRNIYAQGYLARVLNLVGDTWGSAPTKDMVTGNFLGGVYLALRHLDRFEVTDEQTRLSLQGFDVAKLLEMGYERYKSMVTSRSIPGGVAAVIIERFNYRKRADQTVPPYDRSASRTMRAIAASAAVSRETRVRGGHGSVAVQREAGFTGKFRRVK